MDTEETARTESATKHVGRDNVNDNRWSVTISFPLSKITLGRGPSPSAEDFAALAGLVAQLAETSAAAAGEPRAAAEMSEVAERAAELARSSEGD